MGVSFRSVFVSCKLRALAWLSVAISHWQRTDQTTVPSCDFNNGKLEMGHVSFNNVHPCNKRVDVSLKASSTVNKGVPKLTASALALVNCSDAESQLGKGTTLCTGLML